VRRAAATQQRGGTRSSSRSPASRAGSAPSRRAARGGEAGVGFRCGVATDRLPCALHLAVSPESPARVLGASACLTARRRHTRTAHPAGVLRAEPRHLRAGERALQRVPHLSRVGRPRSNSICTQKRQPSPRRAVHAAQDAGGGGGAGVSGAIREVSRFDESSSAGSMRGCERHARGRRSVATPHGGAALIVARVSSRERA
jgi:hypothetical protein